MQRKSIYKYASEAGIPFGIYLTFMSSCLLLSIKVPFLQLLFLPLCIGFPILLWTLLKKIIKAEPSYQKFSSVWLGGIYTVIFGTLICLFFSALYLVFIEPGFVHNYINNAIMAVETSPMAGEYEDTVAMMREAMAMHLLPSGFEFATSMAWFTCFFGSIVSMVLAFFMTFKRRKASPTVPEYNN